jgi:hypothetical protein
MKTRLAAALILVVGCQEWVPATSLADIHNETVRVEAADATVIMDHATAHGTSIDGTPRSHDAPSASVQVRRRDGVETAAIVVLSLLGAAFTVVGGGVLVAFAGMANMR